MKLWRLSKDVFERRTSNGSESFSLIVCLDDTKFVLFRVFTLIETICPKMWAKPLPKNAKVHFRLTCGSQKRLCLKTMEWFISIISSDKSVPSIASPADILRGASRVRGAGSRDAPLRMSEGEAIPSIQQTSSNLKASE